MKINVRFYGELRRHEPSFFRRVELPAGATVADVIERLGLQAGEVWLVKLGDRLVETNYMLQPDDEIALMPPVGGG